ncbi:MAG: 4Fe-4S binding protein [Candidatus Aminicenantes bacterium]|nr:MAG: 4Fe-4S binding protein [Candidatus Aminicenantes bacterium]
MAKIKISSERMKNLKALAIEMNKQNKRPFPVTNELIYCFDAVITPEENDYLLRIGREPLTYEQAASFSDLPEESFHTFFETIMRKGLVWPRYDKEGEKRYVLAAILVGWFEVYLSDGSETPEKQEFARRVDELFKSFSKLNVFPLRNLLNYKFRRESEPHTEIALTKQPNEISKTVEVDVHLPLKSGETKIYPYHSVFELIEKYGDENKIALVHCFCRQWHKMLDKPCRFDIPAESCITLGDMTRHAVDYGVGRLISKEKALKVIQELQEKGAIHQVFFEKDDMNLGEIAICNCCWDCCGVLTSYNRGYLPLHLKSYYYAQIKDSTLCTGCGTCVKYCPTRAFSVVKEKSQINVEKCIGCGQCEMKCPEGVIGLEYRERRVMLPLLKKSEVRISV